MKYKICLVADVPNWAFDSIAKQLKKELSYKYDIKIDYFNRHVEENMFFELIERNNDCDLIHFFNRRMLLLMNSASFKQKVEATGKNIQDYILEKKSKFSTAVYDYMDIDEPGIREHKKLFNQYTKMYYTATQKLFEIYNSIPEFKKPDSMVHDICDATIYTPKNLDRFEDKNCNARNLIVGWVGNSTHNGEKSLDLKGFNTIIKPVLTELINEGYNIEGYFADRNERWILQEDMPNYYNSIDICLCASVHEGTPRPVLESMSCGVPIISTDVGIVSEAFGNKQKEYIIGDRKNGKNDENIKKVLKEKLIQIYNHRYILKELSSENLQSIVNFDGGKTIKAFDDFFNKCLSI